MFKIDRKRERQTERERHRDRDRDRHIEERKGERDIEEKK